MQNCRVSQCVLSSFLMLATNGHIDGRSKNTALVPVVYCIARNYAVPGPCSRRQSADGQTQVRQTHLEPCHQQIPTHSRQHHSVLTLHAVIFGVRKLQSLVYRAALFASSFV